MVFGPFASILLNLIIWMALMETVGTKLVGKVCKIYLKIMVIAFRHIVPKMRSKWVCCQLKPSKNPNGIGAVCCAIHSDSFISFECIERLKSRPAIYIPYASTASSITSFPFQVIPIYLPISYILLSPSSSSSSAATTASSWILCLFIYFFSLFFCI